ncbi:MAG: DUF1540 domain-containing protein [Syntrophomonadaceae bacterium]|jgi:hypothetical protein
MHGRVPKEKRSLQGVKCCVSSCYYYGEGDHCMAAQIEIQPPDARNTQDTDCATFISK